MKRVYTHKVWDELTVGIVVLSGGFVLSIYLLWAKGVPLQDIGKIISMELAVLSLLILVRLLIRSQHVVLDEDGITNVYRGGLLLKTCKRTILWKDITKIRGEFGIFHIGERITIYISRNKMKIWDTIQERDRITISNNMRNFEELVAEIVKRAQVAAVDEGVKKFLAKH